MMMMTTMMIDTSTSVRFPSGATSYSSAGLPHNRPACNLEEVNGAGVNVTSSRFLCPEIARSKFRKFSRSSSSSTTAKNRIRVRACAEHQGSAASDPSKQSGRMRYHPFEEIAESTTSENGGEARLTSQEAARTIVEMNSKATLMLTSLFDVEMHENLVWPDLPYVTDEHGNIYFQVKNDEDILQTLTSENNFVQVIIGFDAMEMLSEMELLGPSEIDFGIEEIEDEDEDEDEDGEDEDEDEDDDEDDDDEDKDYDEDLVAVLEDDEEDDSDETIGDWAKLETMRASHPMFFAKKLAQVASDAPVDWMEQPPAGLAIQGLIRPAFIEEHSDIQRHMASNQSYHADKDLDGRKLEGELEDLPAVNGHELFTGSSDDSSIWEEGTEKDETSGNGMSFYKLEIIKIQLISAHGHQTIVEVDDFRKAQPDAIAHSATKIISRLKAGGEKITEALKSLCWRCKSIQVEEAAVIGVDSLGFDTRVCSGTQIQTLRFAFNSRATSEYSAERQLNDLLFPRTTHRLPKKTDSLK